MATKYEYFSGTPGTYYLSTTTRKCGQSFTVGTVGSNVNFTMDHVVLRLYRTGSPGNVTINIYAVDGNGHPTGDPISTGTLDGDSLTTSSAGEDKEISMSAGELEASTKYALVMENTSTDSVQMNTDYTDLTYDAGIVLDNSGSWVDVSNNESIFEIWGNPVGASGTNFQINIGDTWKEVPAMQIGIGSPTWCEVVGAQINIGDSWQTIF